MTCLCFTKPEQPELNTGWKRASFENSQVFKPLGRCWEVVEWRRCSLLCRVYVGGPPAEAASSVQGRHRAGCGHNDLRPERLDAHRGR